MVRFAVVRMVLLFMPPRLWQLGAVCGSDMGGGMRCTCAPLTLLALCVWGGGCTGNPARLASGLCLLSRQQQISWQPGSQGGNATGTAWGLGVHVF